MGKLQIRVKREDVPNMLWRIGWMVPLTPWAVLGYISIRGLSPSGESTLIFSFANIFLAGVGFLLISFGSVPARKMALIGTLIFVHFFILEFWLVAKNVSY